MSEEKIEITPQVKKSNLKAHLVEYRKKYYKIYREKNKESTKEKAKQYYINNKDRILEKMKNSIKILRCDICDYDIKSTNKGNHELSKKHKKNEILENTPIVV